MSDAVIRIEGQAGRITLNRPEALNAATYQMCLDIEAALDAWAGDDAVKLVIIDAAGDRAFCAGGDLAEMYRTGCEGDFSYGRKFWRDEYRLNAKIAAFPKPYIAFMHGFSMGGGVGLSAHGSHRIVCESSQIAMPECGIGLVPDVGGSFILAKAPGALGAYLGTTGTRLGPDCAILAGFADMFIPQDKWEATKAELIRSGDIAALNVASAPPEVSPLRAMQPQIDAAFGASTMAEISVNLADPQTDWAVDAAKKLSRQSPLSIACAVEIINRVRANPSLEESLRQEFRFTWRSASQGDFIEGIRAQVIDKDRKPNWQHASIADVPMSEIEAMLAPLGDDDWAETNS